MNVKKRLLEFMKEDAYKPMTLEELCHKLEIELKQKNMLKDILDKMEQQGEIIKNEADRYGVPEKMGVCVGRIEGHSQGYAFLIPNDSDHEDVYISLKDLKGAMHNDKVVVRVFSNSEKGRLAGEVINILERANEEIVGEYDSNENFGFVIADDKRIYYDVFVPKGRHQGAKNGDKVVVKVSKWPQKNRNPEGEIIDVLGNKFAEGVDIDAIIKRFDLSEDFPPQVKKEVDKIQANISKQEIQQRKDLRDLKIVTIDGDDAKDFDDGVSLEKIDDKKVRLGVHIADVTHYVKSGSELDQEAIKRATSVYLVDRVIPMLPEKLSNNLCSLRQKEDRLALSVLMEFDLESADLLDYEITESVIKVNHRLTYNQVNQMLEDNNQELLDKYSDISSRLESMASLAQKLRKKRFKRGSIDFNFPEVKVKLDNQGNPVDIVKVERGIGEKLIEDFMIKTNEVVASEMYYREVPFIYRVHEQPAFERLQDLNLFIHNLGYKSHKLDREDLHPKEFQELLEQVAGKAEERVVNTVILRTMRQAHYSPENEGHFGLASDCYSHFTSPIRRYPDLMIHRIIKEVIKKGVLKPERREYLEDRLYEVAEHSSVQEREAMDAERETIDLKKAEYMKDKVGEVYEGVVSSVASFGIFVELENTIEGLVHVANLTDDYYHYHEDKRAFIGEVTGQTYNLGDEVKVKVDQVNISEQQIDFKLAD